MTLGSARPVHANDLSTYTHLIWCTAGKTKSIDVNWFAPQSSFLGLKKSAGHDFFTERLSGAEWAAVSNQFFATLFAPLDGKANAVWGRRFDIPQAEGAPSLGAVEGAMGMPGLTLQPGQNATVRFEIYAGPKLYHRLAQLEHNEAEILDFGVFKIICQALLNLMNLLHHYLGNYAAAILALTTIVKLCLWPLQSKANRSMRRMSALSPKMQELREKYKDDPTRMNQEVMKLYKDYGINPVSGCAPMLIQIPIFFGLFTMLRQTVELRNASFLWVHDLSQPDTVGHIPDSRLAAQHSPAPHGPNERLDDAHHAQNRRRHAAARHDVHAHHLYRVLLQLCSRAFFVLYNSEPLHDHPALPKPAATSADFGKSDSGAEEIAWRKTMSPKELLDTILGYLGFVVDIDEQTMRAEIRCCKSTPRKAVASLGAMAKRSMPSNFFSTVSSSRKTRMRQKSPSIASITVRCAKIRSCIACANWLSASASPGARFSSSR